MVLFSNFLGLKNSQPFGFSWRVPGCVRIQIYTYIYIVCVCWPLGFLHSIRHVGSRSGGCSHPEPQKALRGFEQAATATQDLGNVLAGTFRRLLMSTVLQINVHEGGHVNNMTGMTARA